MAIWTRSCQGKPDGHLPRFPTNLLAQMTGAEYSCAYCGAPVDREGRAV